MGADPVDLPELRRLAEAATKGPWTWAGSIRYGMYLAHWREGWGQCTVMDFVRHGMNGAQPRFADPNSHLNHKAVDIAVREVPYRDDVVALDHPDARWIAAASPDVVLALLDRIDALEDAVRQALDQRDHLDAGYAEAGRLLRRIIREQVGSDFVDPEVGGSFAVCADMDAVELAAWLHAELKEPGSADPGAVAGEPESEGTTDG